MFITKNSPSHSGRQKHTWEACQSAIHVLGVPVRLKGVRDSDFVFSRTGEEQVIDDL